MEFLESSESQISDSFAMKWQVLDGFTQSVETSSQVLSGVNKAAGGVLLSFHDSVVRFVSCVQSDNASLCFFSLNLSASQSNGSIIAKTGVGSIVEIGQVEGVM